MFQKIIVYFFAVTLILVFFSKCKTVGDKSTDNQHATAVSELMKKDSIEKLPPLSFDTIRDAQEKNPEQIIYNSDRSLKLKFKKIQKKGDPATHFDYEVYEVKTGTLIEKDTYRGMAIGWHDSISLKLIPYVGIVQKETLSDPLDENTKQQFQIKTLNLK